MYADDRTTVVDFREALKVKVKSLAAEARIIRREELKSRGVLRDRLHRHRIDVVRHECRHANIAYGLIRGRTIAEMEPKSNTCFDWTKVEKMIKAYGNPKVTIPRPEGMFVISVGNTVLLANAA